MSYSVAIKRTLLFFSCVGMPANTVKVYKIGLGRSHPMLALRNSSLILVSMSPEMSTTTPCGHRSFQPFRINQATSCRSQGFEFRRLILVVLNGLPHEADQSVVNFLGMETTVLSERKRPVRVMPRYLGSAQKGRDSPLRVILNLRLASLLFKWKAADTVLAVLIFSLHFWKKGVFRGDCMSWLKGPLTFILKSPLATT